jgi:predicted MFS family arabinose efflux permease
MTASLVGTWMQNVAQSWLIYRLTHSEFMLGAVGFLAHFPTLLLGPIGGVIADRFERRKIVVIAQSLFLVQATLLAVLTLTGYVTVPWVLGLAAFQGLVDVVDRPARQAMLIQLAGADDLLSAISLNSVMFNAARVIGPSIAGIVIARFGEGIAFSANAVSFLAVLVSLLALRLPAFQMDTDKHPLDHLIEGLRYVVQSPKVWPLLAISSAVNAAAGPVFVLLPFFADATFGKGSAGVGFLTASMGVGAIIGTLGLASRRTNEGLPGVIFTGSLTLGAAIALFAWSPAFALSMAAMFVIGYSIMRQNASTNTQVQTMIDESFRGRVMGVYSMTNVGVLPIGSLAGGALAQSFGAQWTVFACGVLCVLAAFAFRRWSART